MPRFSVAPGASEEGPLLFWKLGCRATFGAGSAAERERAAPACMGQSQMKYPDATAGTRLLRLAPCVISGTVFTCPSFLVNSYF